MATLKERLSEQMKTSLKAGDKETLAFARNIHAVIRKKEIDDRVELNDEDVVKVILSLAKQRQDSISQFKAGGREDLVKKEEAELKFLQSYLPTQMDEEEIQKWVAWAVTEAKASGPKDVGQVMKVLLPKVQGRADGKRVNQLVRERLGSN